MGDKGKGKDRLMEKKAPRRTRVGSARTSSDSSKTLRRSLPRHDLARTIGGRLSA
jgi:hypothetical protein